jgi:hypothetical protein
VGASDINSIDSLNFQTATEQERAASDRILSFHQRAVRSLYELLYSDLGDTRTHALLTHFGYRCGQEDFEDMRRRSSADADDNFVASGTFMKEWESLVQVQPKFLQYDRATAQFHMHGEWKNSYEASLYRELNGSVGGTHCFSLTGYASGWASAFFGKELLAIETMCESHGDPHCRFEIRPVSAWGPEAAPWRYALGTQRPSRDSKPHDELKSAESELSKLSVIDEVTLEALKASLADIAVTRELVESFILDADQLVTQILEGDQVTARRAAHTLKSTAPVFGARRLASLAAEAETTAPIQGPKAEVFKQALADVVSQLRFRANQD